MAGTGVPEADRCWVIGKNHPKRRVHINGNRGCEYEQSRLAQDGINWWRYDLPVGDRRHLGHSALMPGFPKAAARSSTVTMGVSGAHSVLKCLYRPNISLPLHHWPMLCRIREGNGRNGCIGRRGGRRDPIAIAVRGAPPESGLYSSVPMPARRLRAFSPFFQTTDWAYSDGFNATHGNVGRFRRHSEGSGVSIASLKPLPITNQRSSTGYLTEYQRREC